MKSETILRAMGGIDEKLIEDACIVNFKRKKYGRPLRVAIAAALVLCMLGTAAWAASNWRVSEPREGFTPTDPAGNSHQVFSHDILLQLPVREDAPALIGAYYYPKMPHGFTPTFGYAYASQTRDKLCDLTFFWESGDGWVRFTQESVSHYEGEIRTTVHTGSEEPPQIRDASLGGIDGILITFTTDKNESDQIFYWTDGQYIFYLDFCGSYTQEQLAKTVAAVKKTEDITPHLISMTDEEIRKTFP